MSAFVCKLCLTKIENTVFLSNVFSLNKRKRNLLIVCDTHLVTSTYPETLNLSRLFIYFNSHRGVLFLWFDLLSQVRRHRNWGDEVLHRLSLWTGCTADILAYQSRKLTGVWMIVAFHLEEFPLPCMLVHNRSIVKIIKAPKTWVFKLPFFVKKPYLGAKVRIPHAEDQV